MTRRDGFHLRVRGGTSGTGCTVGLRVEERIVAGGEGDEVLVHHLVLRGSNRAIGRHLGELVRARYGAPAPAGGDPLRDQRAGLRWSAAFIPAPLTASARPLVVRNLGLAGPLARPRRGDPPPVGRPYVMELHPEEGYPSLAVCAFELEGAALDGVNGEGLVAIAAPGAGQVPAGPAPTGAGGLDELQVVRYLLDRCATALEAVQALGGGRLYRGPRPARWLVADRAGRAFLVESAEGSVRWREATEEPLEVASHRDEGPLRTLWHGEYEATERRLVARFFLGPGDWRGGEAPELRFQL